MNRSIATVLALALAALPLGAASPVGVVVASGGVWTNHVALPSGSSLYAGDELRTGADSLAVVESPAAGRVEFRAGTRATVGDGFVALNEGAVASRKLAVQVDGAEVAPADPSADNWFVVEQRDGRQIVAAHRGAVVIREGLAPAVVVPAGSYAMAAAAPAPRSADANSKDRQPATTAGDDKNKKRRRGGAAAGAAKNSKWSIGKMGHGASVAVVGGAAAAATAVGVGLVAFNDDAASPQD